MAIEIQGKVGPQFLADGTIADPRLGKSGETITQDAHGRYFEMGYRNKSFLASTAVGGVAPGTALSTTPPFALWNPPNSGVIASINKAQFGYVSGTLGGGSIVWAQYTAQVSAPTTGTVLTPVSAMTGSNTSGSIKAYQGSTVAGTPTIVRPSIIIGAFLATTATISPPIFDEVAGELLIAPGSLLCLHGVAAAGTSPLILFSVYWEEVPV